MLKPNRMPQRYRNASRINSDSTVPRTRKNYLNCTAARIKINCRLKIYWTVQGQHCSVLRIFFIQGPLAEIFLPSTHSSAKLTLISFCQSFSMALPQQLKCNVCKEKPQSTTGFDKTTFQANQHCRCTPYPNSFSLFITVRNNEKGINQEYYFSSALILDGII